MRITISRRSFSKKIANYCHRSDTFAILRYSSFIKLHQPPWRIFFKIKISILYHPRPPSSTLDPPYTKLGNKKSLLVASSLPRWQDHETITFPVDKARCKQTEQKSKPKQYRRKLSGQLMGLADARTNKILEDTPCRVCGRITRATGVVACYQGERIRTPAAFQLWGRARSPSSCVYLFLQPSLISLSFFLELLSLDGIQGGAFY